MGDDDWNEVTRKNRGYRTKEDDLAKVSMSIYVTNFPESCSAKDLFQSCKVYGHVVDSYIPLKRSKSGKRFGFVRFINVFSVERLISNLCTIWIGKFRLHANITKFQRPSVNTNASVPFGGNGNAPHIHVYNSQSHSGKWNNPVRNKDKDGRKENISHSDEKMNRDEECLVDRDLDNSVMGEVLHFSSLNNLRVLLYNEGFADVEIMYLGGLWVMIKLGSYKSKLNFMKHLGVASWFAKLCNAQNDFVANERIVWVDIEGVPLNAWSRKSFHKIGLKMGGRLMDVEEPPPETNAAVNDIEDIPDANVEEESNCEAVSDTCFGDSEEVPVKEKENIQSVNDKEVSKDPFGIYEILNRSKGKEVETRKRKEGGSILDALDDMIKVGQAMGFTMDGCTNDMEKIIGSNGEHEFLDQGGVTDDVLLSRMETMKQLHDLNSSNNIDFVQKAKVRWAIEGDENTKFFHGVINRKRVPFQ
ncbi:RNA-directed DNA polymerase, eukaryota [Tanacetum coccineum]|uniref:RNA-directed DNA polymerase, eukaryota n=1 Tax=Tanacetum coccineum TaxID=301880 RepID=A0ABQ4YAD4_9ASTR